MPQGRKTGTRRAGHQAHRAQHSPENTPEAASARTADILLAGGSLGLLLAIIGSGILAMTHVMDLNPPGCGPGSGCDEATRSVWGSVPGLGWPTAHVGLAFFIAVTAAWIAAMKRGFTDGFMWLVRIGAMVSVALTVVMLVNGYLCRYCLMAHGGNLLFWACAETARRKGAGEDVLPLRAAVGAFVFATLLLIPVEVIARQQTTEQVAETRVEDVQKMIEAPNEEREGFTGRYLLGPEEAAIRIVAFTDYQCPDCQRFETELRGIMAERDDISLSVKQFPMSDKCNKYMPRDMHANACMAARAAEAAGIIGGEVAFWDMHFWLFDEGGEFTDATFPADLREMGYDSQEFINIMLSDQTLELVEQDIEEGMALGLFFTPMVFINGVELRNPHFPGNLTKTIEELSKRNPQPMTVVEAQDTPPTADEKYVNDWAAGRAFNLPQDTHGYPRGTSQPKTDVVMWGDYQDEMTSRIDMYIRFRFHLQEGIRYNFRHFPVDKSCNEFAWETVHPQACMAAQAVESAGILGGEDAWWDMHSSMAVNYLTMRPQLVFDVAENLGLDHEVIRLYMDSGAGAEAIQEDITAGKQFGLNRIPYIFINGKKIDRLTMGGELKIGLIFDHLLGELTEEQKRQMEMLAPRPPQQIRYRDSSQQPSDQSGPQPMVAP